MRYKLHILTLIAFLASSLSSEADAGEKRIERALMFHDQGPLFASTNEPTASTPIVIKFRAKKNDLTGVSVKYFDAIDRQFHIVPMKVNGSANQSDFDYWQATLPASKTRKAYRFRLSNGPETFWYNARGLSEEEPTEGDFQVVPGFKTPDWLKNGVVYQIFPDRFYNGDQSNDVKTNQYKHAGASTSQKQWGDSTLPKDGEDRSFTFYGGDFKA